MLMAVTDVTDARADARLKVDLLNEKAILVQEVQHRMLKHAFPDQPIGKIIIDYAAKGREWALSVTDDGIGMPTGQSAPKAGLGTGFVEALTKNLLGELHVSDAKPGTIVTIRHRGGPEAPAALPSAA